MDIKMIACRRFFCRSQLTPPYPWVIV